MSNIARYLTDDHVHCDYLFADAEAAATPAEQRLAAANVFPPLEGGGERWVMDNPA